MPNLFYLGKKNFIHLIVVLAFFITLGLLLGHIGDFLERDIVQNYIKGAGIWGPLVYVVLLLITFIIAPLTGFPIVVIGIGAFGVAQALFITYLVSLLAAAINFYISHFLGRSVVARLVGKKGLEKIDKLAEKFELEALILSRLFQGFLFEWISYAAGFTNIRFRVFFLVTAFGCLPYFVIIYYYSTHITNLTELFIKVALTNYALLPIPFLYFLSKRAILRLKKKKNRVTLN